MTDVKNITSIIPVLDKYMCYTPIIKFERSTGSKKEIDKLVMSLNYDYLKITEDNNNYTGWTYDEKNLQKYKNKKEQFSQSINNNIKLNSKIKILTKSYSTSSIPAFLNTKNLYFNDDKNKITFETKKTKKNDDNIYKTNNIVKEKININMEINGLKDLIQLIRDNPIIDNVEYNIDINTLHKIKGPLNELNEMIGMTSLKDNIVDQVIYYIQNFHKLGKCQGDFMHTVIYGPPGTGKTEIAKIIGRIFSKLGILNKGTFRKVTRADLIAGYLGQTAIKTKEVIKDCLGGVLFIDEAYALGNSEKRDSFSKECIDTLCEALSDNKDNIMVIIAGYEEELKSCFFNYNDGLESRFSWRFKIDKYTSDELKNIFLKKIKDAGWTIDKNTDLKTEWFSKNKDYFKYYGRDMENLFAKTKICHSRRVFCKPKEIKTKITMEDIEKGFNLYLNNDEVKSRKNTSWSSISYMYN